MELGVFSCIPSLELPIFLLRAWITDAIPDCCTWRDAEMSSTGLFVSAFP